MWKSTGIFIVVFTSQILFGSCGFLNARRYVSMPPIFHMDDFDRCMLYGDEALYCNVEVQLHPENPDNSSELWETITEYSSSSSNYRHDLLRHGLCIPDTFPTVSADSLRNQSLVEDHLVTYYNKKFEYAGMKSEIVKIHCETQESFYPIDNYDIFVGVLLVLYVAFVIFASFHEVISNKLGAKNTENSHRSFISAFSIPKNWRRLVTVNWDNPDVQNLRCIQGVRFYNMVIVIAAHTFFINLSGPISNTLYVETLTEKFIFPMFSNGGFAVQTNFMISTWLVTYYFFVTFENAKEVKPKFFLFAFIQRYLRLIPTLAVVVALHNTWMVRFSRGPAWDMIVGDAHRDCRKTSWSNLLLINNYVGDGRMCMPETWYICNDTQFFIAALFLLTYLLKNRRKLPIVVGSILAVHVGVIFYLIYTNNWEFLVRPTPEGLYGTKLLQGAQFHATMISIWASIPGFVGGIVFGYVYYKYRADVKFFNTPIKTAAWWIFIWTVALGIILIPGSILLSPDRQYNALHSAIYASTGRILFTLAIGLTLIGMIQGSGRLMKKVCEFEPLYVLGRLTYSVYLTHVFIMRILVGSRRSPMYLSDFVMLADLFRYTVLTYALSLVLTLLFEMPVSQLLKNYVPNAKKNDKISEKNSVKTDADGLKSS